MFSTAVAVLSAEVVAPSAEAVVAARWMTMASTEDSTDQGKALAAAAVAEMEALAENSVMAASVQRELLPQALRPRLKSASPKM